MGTGAAAPSLLHIPGPQAVVLADFTSLASPQRGKAHSRRRSSSPAQTRRAGLRAGGKEADERRKIRNLNGFSAANAA